MNKLEQIFNDYMQNSYATMPNAVETANGVMYFEPQGDKIVFGGATNMGIIPEYEFEYDFDESFDWNIQGMIEQVLDAEGYPGMEDTYESYKPSRGRKLVSEGKFDDEDMEYEYQVVRKNALANPNLYDGRYTQKSSKDARKEFKKDYKVWDKNTKSWVLKYPESYKSSKKSSRKINEAADNEIRIFLTNLGKYNEGDLVGEWVTLPVDDDFEAVKQRIGINDEYEEWFITDYEAPFKIDEYDNIYELNQIAETMQGLDDTDKEVLTYCLEYENMELDAALEVIQNRDYIYIEANNDTEFGEAFIYEVEGGIENIPSDILERYFDYEAYGRDIAFDYVQLNNGYIKLV